MYNIPREMATNPTHRVHAPRFIGSVCTVPIYRYFSITIDVFLVIMLAFPIHISMLLRMSHSRRFLQASGKVIKKKPVINGELIDLSRLYRVVSRRGGYHAVSAQKAWRDIAGILEVSRDLANFDVHCPIFSYAGQCDSNCMRSNVSAARAKGQGEI